MLELAAMAVTAIDPGRVVGVAEVEPAPEAPPVELAVGWLRAARRVVAGLAAASARCAVDEGGELAVALGAVARTEAALGGGAAAGPPL